MRKAFAIPENVEPMALVIVGYPKENPQTEERFDAKKVHWNKW